MISKTLKRKNIVKQKFYSKIGDMFCGSLRGEEWNSLPRNVYRRFLVTLNILQAGFKKIGGKNLATITTYSGVTFFGPTNPEHWNCHPKRIEYLKPLLDQSCGNKVLTDGHCALVHNIIVRYMTEFSAYPYQAFRTYNLLPGDIFFDVGAFRGYVTLKAAQKIGENGFVYAVEPINENIAFIKAHAQYNNLTNIKVIEGAISTNELDENIQFYTTNNQANSSIPDYLPTSSKSIRMKNISTVSLVKMINNKFTSHKRAIVSITINGNEMDVVKSIVKEFEKSSIKYLEITIPIIYTREKVSSFTTYMENKGFRIEKYYPWFKMINVR